MYRRFFKRCFDISSSLAVLIVLAIPMIVVAILVKLKLGSPIIFKQQRPGKDEKIFTMYKFRTMTDEKDANGELLSDEVRLTKFGRWLRSTSLDELPELINIIKGDMSVVGPRPLLVKYLELYDEEQKHRHDVKPGLTGLAQISGRNELDWKDRFKIDVEYVRNVSFIGDMSIIFNSVIAVVCKKGISSNSCETMESFLGNN